MRVSEAIRTRSSCRVFLRTPLKREVLQELLKLTCAAPSAINLQPWQFTVVMGEEVGRLSKKLLRAHAERGVGCKPDSAQVLDQVYQDRQDRLSKDMKPLLAEAGADFANFINHGSLNFYGAPTVVVATLDRVFGQGRSLDVGLALGWLLLAAEDMGLATCPIGLVCAYQDVIKDFLNIDEGREVVLAVAVGQRDPEAVVNRMRSTRADLSEVVRWY